MPERVVLSESAARRCARRTAGRARPSRGGSTRVRRAGPRLPAHGRRPAHGPPRPRGPASPADRRPAGRGPAGPRDPRRRPEAARRTWFASSSRCSCTQARGASRGPARHVRRAHGPHRAAGACPGRDGARGGGAPGHSGGRLAARWRTPRGHAGAPPPHAGGGEDAARVPRRRAAGLHPGAAREAPDRAPVPARAGVHGGPRRIPRRRSTRGWRCSTRTWPRSAGTCTTSATWTGTRASTADGSRGRSSLARSRRIRARLRRRADGPAACVRRSSARSAPSPCTAHRRPARSARSGRPCACR